MALVEVFTELRDTYQADSEGKYSSNQLRDTHIMKWTDATGLSRAQVYDGIAMWLARGFHRLEFDFDFCDAIVNDLYSIATSTNRIPELSTIFWDTFEAFDRGEFSYEKDQPEDPIEKYTRPGIARIVSQLPVDSMEDEVGH